MRWRIAALQGATRKPSMTCSARGRRVLVQVAYAGGLRISELVALTWGQVIRRDDGKVQLNVLGKGNKPSQVLLPDVVSNALLKLRGDAGDEAPIFANRAAARSPIVP